MFEKPTFRRERTIFRKSLRQLKFPDYYSIPTYFVGFSTPDNTKQGISYDPFIDNKIISATSNKELSLIKESMKSNKSSTETL